MGNNLLLIGDTPLGFLGKGVWPNSLVLYSTNCCYFLFNSSYFFYNS
jgi:hypothetical protein